MGWQRLASRRVAFTASESPARDIRSRRAVFSSEEQSSSAFAPEIDNGSADEVEEQEFVEEMASAVPEDEIESAAAQSHVHPASVEFEDDMEEESFEPSSIESEPHAVAGEPVEDSARHESVGTEDESAEPERDRSASHNVDPLPPVEFRLFGLGGKKKKPEDVPLAPVPEESRPAFTPVASSFSPGSGSG